MSRGLVCYTAVTCKSSEAEIVRSIAALTLYQDVAQAVLSADDNTFTTSTPRILPALDKLFWKAPSRADSSKTGKGTSRLTMCNPDLGHGQRSVKIKTSELYEWLDDHRELLQKLHSGSEMPDLSALLLEEC